MSIADGMVGGIFRNKETLFLQLLTGTTSAVRVGNPVSSPKTLTVVEMKRSTKNLDKVSGCFFHVQVCNFAVGA
jgi:hypothetical protein